MFRKPSIRASTPVLILGASIAVLGAAFGFEHLGGYEPCPLCLYQRGPWAVAIVLTLAALLLLSQRHDRWARSLVYLCGVGFLAGAGIAAYHVGIEESWWQGPVSCTAAATAADSIDALMAEIEGQPVVLCDVVQWRLFGLSMAGYNLLLSLTAGVFSLSPMLWRLVPGADR